MLRLEPPTFLAAGSLQPGETQQVELVQKPKEGQRLVAIQIPEVGLVIMAATDTHATLRNSGTVACKYLLFSAQELVYRMFLAGNTLAGMLFRRR